MNFKIIPSKSFNKQITQLGLKSKKLIYNKIQLLKENPYRYKRVHSRLYSKVFSVRLKIDSKETRLIYVVINLNIILTCLLARKKDYKDLEKYLSKIKKELNL